MVSRVSVNMGAKQVRWCIFILLCVWASASQAGTPPATPQALRIPRVSTAPRLKDYLDGHSRDDETRVTDFRQYEPADGVPASRKTSAYLSYDDKNLYVIFVCQDDAGKVRARMVPREAIQDDDQVGVILDTFRDRHRAYRFYVNPLGIQADSIKTEGQKNDPSFDTVWQSEGQLTEDGFVVRIAIPFRSLRFSNDADQTWGMALARVIVARNETSYWPYISRRLEAFVPQLATLTGLSDISPGRNMQLIPHSVFSGARFLDSSGPLGPRIRKATDAGVGMDAKLVLHDSLTLDVTGNPDVSEVESDQPQVTINRRFKVFYPEKRPFFTENAGFFQTSEYLFDSRRIVDPQAGSRLTGKIGRWALGALATDDRAPGESQPRDSSLYGDRAGVGVLRVQREFGDKSYAGMFVSNRNFGSSFNRVLSFDTRLRLNPNWTLRAQAVRSDARKTDRTRLKGSDYSAAITHSGRHFQYSSSYIDRSPNFRADLGFIPRVDIRVVSNTGSYLWRPKNRWVVDFGPSAFSTADWNTRGQRQDRSEGAGFNVDLVHQTHVEVAYAHGFERFLDLNFQRNYENITFWTSRLKWLSFYAYYGRGAGIDYYPAANQAPFSAASRDAATTVTVRFTPRIRWDQDYIYSRLGTRAGLQPAGSRPGASIFNDHIFRSKLNYQLTRGLSLRVIFDYDAVLANPSLIANPVTKHAGADFLFTYLLNPGTAVYLGYTDGYDNLALDATVPARLRYTPAPALSTGRQFFVKLSYLFRY